MELSEDQSKVLNSLLSNFQGQYYSAPIVTTVGGYAGTGKTTLLCELRNQINKEKSDSIVAESLQTNPNNDQGIIIFKIFI